MDCALPEVGNAAGKPPLWDCFGKRDNERISGYASRAKFRRGGWLLMPGGGAGTIPVS
jgi:hypothetical protein